MTNVLLLIDNLGSGGAQNQLSLLAILLKRKGYNVQIFTYYPQNFFSERLIENGIHVLYTPKQDKIGFNVIRELYSHIKQHSIDIVISYLDTPNFYASLTKLLLKKRIKFISSYRSTTNFEGLSRFAFLQRKFVNTMSDDIVANSHHERISWQSKDMKNAHKWSTIYNCIDKKTFNANDSQVKENHFLVVGSISSDKNGLLILEALRILLDKGHKINIQWTGQKVFNIPDRKAYLDLMEAKIIEYKLQPYFSWVAQHTKIADEYRKCKALILASQVEGLPNVVCEAMSCGTICIVSDVLDHPKLIKDGENGYLFDPTSADDLADAIMKVNNLSSSTQTEMSINTLNRADQLFNEEVFISSYMKLMHN
jgi:glycosyltransferase involved in cell wall biosynthesis